MDRTQPPTSTSRFERQLAHLKIISRLLGHELHAQSSPRLTLSREEILEIQTSIDLFIEESMRGKGAGPAGSDVEVTPVSARVN